LGIRLGLAELSLLSVKGFGESIALARGVVPEDLVVRRGQFFFSFLFLYVVGGNHWNVLITYS